MSRPYKSTVFTVFNHYASWKSDIDNDLADRKLHKFVKETTTCPGAPMRILLSPLASVMLP